MATTAVAVLYAAAVSISESDSERDSSSSAPPLSSNSLSSSSDTQTETESPPETPSRAPTVVTHNDPRGFKQTRPSAVPVTHNDPFAFHGEEDARHHAGYESEMEDLQATPEKKERGSPVVRWWMQPTSTGAKLRDKSLPRTSLHGSPRHNGSPRLVSSPQQPAPTTPTLESTPRPSLGQITPTPNRPLGLSSSSSIIRGRRPSNPDLSSIPPYRKKQWPTNQAAVGLGLGIPSSLQKQTNRTQGCVTEPRTPLAMPTFQSPSGSPGRLAAQRSASAPTTPSIGFIPQAPLLQCAPFPPSLNALRPLDPSPLYSPSPLDLPPAHYRRRHARIVSQPATSTTRAVLQADLEKQRTTAPTSTTTTTPPRRPGFRNTRLRLSVNVIQNLPSTALHSPVPRTLKGSAPRMVSLDPPPFPSRRARVTARGMLGIMSPELATPLSHRPSVLSPFVLHREAAYRSMFMPGTPWAEGVSKSGRPSVESGRQSTEGVENGDRTFNPYFAVVEGEE